MTTTTKTCTKCKQTKSVEKFYFSTKAKDGRFSWCSKCTVASTDKARDGVNQFLLNWKQEMGIDISRKDLATLFGLQHQKNIDSFKNKTIRTEDGCLLWTGYTYNNGYGGFNVHVSTGLQTVCVKAHRFAWAMEHGWLPENTGILSGDTLVLNHLCHNRRCVEPSHLEVISIRENNSPEKRRPKQVA